MAQDLNGIAEQMIAKMSELEAKLQECQDYKEIAKLNDKEKALAKAPEIPRQLLGLRKYLLDFSLIGEREIKEMPLWKEYLVYATLFGIADKVCDNFATVYPDFFQTNSIAGTRLNIVGNNALVSYGSASLEGMKEGRSWIK